MEKVLEKIKEFLESLEGSRRHETSKYIAYKIAGNNYVELRRQKEYLGVMVRRKYVLDEEVESLNIEMRYEGKWTHDTELKIYEETELEKYLLIIKRAYEMQLFEYKKKIKEGILNVIEKNKNELENMLNNEEYVFEKLLDKFNEYSIYEISSSELDEMRSDISMLNKFNSKEFLENYSDNKTKYNFIKVVFELIAYIDSNGYNKNIYNKYDDKRTLALTFVRQNIWVENLINYKRDSNLSKVPEVVRNVILYIKNPEKRVTGFKLSKLNKFLQYVEPEKKDEDTYELVCDRIFEYFKDFEIAIKNIKNNGCLYGVIIFFGDLYKEWDRENNYWKLQPYKNKDVDKDIIDRELSNGIITAKEKSILEKSNGDIFYVVDEKNKPMFLGCFTEIISKEEGNIKRRFKIIKKATDEMSIEGINKSFGMREGQKTAIFVQPKERWEFEELIIGKVFSEDIDEIMKEIDLYDEKIELEISEGEEEESIVEKNIDTALNTILYGPPGTGKTYNTINYAVSIIEQKEALDVIEESKNEREKVFERYKDYLANKRIVFTTFHPNYSYEEFIQGIKANVNNIETLSFKKEDGVFKDLVERAKVDLENNYVIIIDEINRGNISRIFGELITLIEDDKRLGTENEVKVTLPSKEIFGVPQNLYIIGTMNTADKSIALIDIALRRRFEFIGMYPDYNSIPKFENILRAINKEIYNRKRSADYLIGHAFFINKDVEELEKIVNRKLLPLLNEYFYGSENEVKEIFSKAGIEVEMDMDTFQLKYKGME